MPVPSRPRLARADIAAALKSLQPAPQAVVLVHSSLSKCGFIKGGAEAVISSLEEWLGTGTLAMPSHTYCYPDQNGNSEIYDGRQTHSRVGAITEAFWRQPAVKRSLHPTHSLAARGVDAQFLTSRHEECETPCGQ